MLSAKLKREVDKKAGKIVSFREAWIQAIGRATESGLDENSVVRVVGVFESPASLLKLSDSIGKVSLEDQGPLLKQIEKYAVESDFSIDQWLQALERILQFLIKQNRSSSLKVLLGYLSCSAEYLSNSTALLSFADGVDSFIEEFGFEG